MGPQVGAVPQGAGLDPAVGGGVPGPGVRRVFFRRSETQGGLAGPGSQPPTAPKQESVIEKLPESTA